MKTGTVSELASIVDEGEGEAEDVPVGECLRDGESQDSAVHDRSECKEQETERTDIIIYCRQHCI